MNKILFSTDRYIMTQDYREGKLPSGWYRFYCGAEHVGYLTNDEDAAKEIEAKRDKDLTIITDPYLFYERQKGTQYITAGNYLFIGRLNFLTILEKLARKPDNDTKN